MVLPGVAVSPIKLVSSCQENCSVVDKYVENSGTWYNGINPEDQSESSKSAWDGRDHLGQIVSPGAYLIHIEAYNFSTGATYKDMAPIVVGVNP